MNKELKEILKTAALDTLADRAGITPEKIQESRQALYMDMQPSAMPPAMPPTQPMPNQMQRPMNVKPADPRRMANMQNVKQALESESQLDNLAMMRRAARGGQALEGFAGKVPGQGHGMEDNVVMPILDRGGVAAVSPKEYVVPADVMAMIGNGNADDGAKEMDGFIEDFRMVKYGRPTQPPEMNGRSALQSLMKT